jgi:hypothetical protein
MQGVLEAAGHQLPLQIDRQKARTGINMLVA